MLNNGTLWADIFLTRNGANPNPHHNKFNPVDIHHVRKRLFPLSNFRSVKLWLNKALNFSTDALHGEGQKQEGKELAFG